MTQGTRASSASKEELRRFRSARADAVRAAVDAHKARLATRTRIRKELAKGPATVPAVASACSLPTREVMWHVAAMRKYGELVEDAQEGSYLTYRLVRPEGQSEPA